MRGKPISAHTERMAATLGKSFVLDQDALSPFPAKIGRKSLGKRLSDGETLCTGCWDESGCNIKADHSIPAGHAVYFSEPHPEYGDCDAYCIKHAIESAESDAGWCEKCLGDLVRDDRRDDAALAERAAVVAFGRRYVAAVTAIAGKGRLGSADRVHELVGQVTAFIDQIEQGLHVDEGARG